MKANKISKDLIYKKRKSIVSVSVNKRNLWKKGPDKSLCVSLKNTGGRNNRGRITCKTKVNTYRKIYRKIDFYRKESAEGAIIKRIEYDPNRTAFIGLIEYIDSKKKSYIALQDGAKVDSVVNSGSNSSYNKIANCCMLRDIPIGTIISMVSTKPSGPAVLARAAGTFVKLINKITNYASILLPSGKTIQVLLDCTASIGRMSNINHSNTILGKAGNNRKSRPRVRGIAQNPHDHCNGGRTKGGKIFRNFKGNMIKGRKTVHKRK